MNNERKTAVVMWVLAGVFAAAAAAFIGDAWARTDSRPPIPLVDPAFLDQATVRTSYADLVRAKEDLSDFDCLGCHEKDKPPVVRYDEQQKIIVPPEHENIKLGHGTHGRNNNCYNCHNEANLATLSARDGHELSFAQSSQICGSCHGPTIRDWDSGSHGRTNGYWNLAQGPAVKKDCVNCHDPHSPKFPGRKPAPGPHSLHSEIASEILTPSQL